jgi:polyisoprenoid-binding protein YceI
VVAPDGTVSGRLVIDTGSIDTRNKRRDEHLRSADFFEVDTYPTLIYTVTGASPVGDKVKVSGDFTVHGQTRPVEVLATVTDDGPDRVRITAEVDIDRSQWGLTWAKMGARLTNHVVVNAQFSKT